MLEGGVRSALAVALLRGVMRRRKTKGKGGDPASHTKGNADRDGSSIATSSKRVDFLGTGRGFAVTAILLFSARLLSSAFNILHDCDETYNYWEPLHYLLYKSGFQTWEYRYAYATPLLSGGSRGEALLHLRCVCASLADPRCSPAPLKAPILRSDRTCTCLFTTSLPCLCPSWVS